MSLLIYSLIAIFATSAILEAWFHEGGIFENIRNKVIKWSVQLEAPVTYNYKPCRGPYASPEPITQSYVIKQIFVTKLAQLLDCRKCLTYWVAAVSFLLIFISQYFMYTSFIIYIFIILAIIRGVHIVDACFDYIWSHVLEADDE